MKILVTGCTSQQCNPKASNRTVTMAWLLAEALRDAGHEVEHRSPRVLEQVEDIFDHAFVGLGPLHGMGTSKSYGSLAVILRMWAQDKLTLYIDDPESGKILGGYRTVLADPDARFTKEFFVFKTDWAIAKEEPWRSWLLSGVEMLRDNAWPRLLLPAFPWADAVQLARKIPQAEHATSTVDLSAYLPRHNTQIPIGGREREWVTETGLNDKWVSQQRSVLPIRKFGKQGEKRPYDAQLCQIYASVWGVLQPPLDYGFWTPRMAQAAEAGALYVTRWQDVETLGDAYGLLPDTASQMTEDQRDEWAAAQLATFKLASSNKDRIKECLTSIIIPQPEKAAMT